MDKSGWVKLTPVSTITMSIGSEPDDDGSNDPVLLISFWSTTWDVWLRTEEVEVLFNPTKLLIVSLNRVRVISNGVNW